MTDARLKEIERRASEAFWQTVAEECPEITTGDFPPDLHYAMTHHNESFIKAWFEINKV